MATRKIISTNLFFYFSIDQIIKIDRSDLILIVGLNSGKISQVC